MDKNDLQIVVSAKDEASSVLQKVGQSSTDLSKSVFLGTAAWNIFSKSVTEAKDLLEESVGAFVNAQRSTDITRTTIESMGVSYASVKDKLDQFSVSLAASGADNNDAALAAAKLAKLAGGDLATGMLLAKKAADLTASGYNDFNTNVDNLTRILTGKGQRALMDYRVNLSDTATTAEQLTAVFGKITQTNDQMSDTLPGKINEFKSAIQQAKEEIGKGFVVAMIGALDTTNSFQGVLDSVSTAAKGAAVGFNILTSSISAIKDLGETAIAAPVVGALSILNKLGIVSDQQLKNAMGSAKQSADDLGKAINDVTSPVATYEAAVKKYESSTKSTNSASKDWLSTIGKIANANSSTQNSLDSYSKSVSNLGDAYKKMKDEASTSMAGLADDFQRDMKSINDSISSTQKQITQLTSSFNRQAGTDAADMADKVIASEQKIKDLKIQIANETDTMKKSQLQSQLNDEQKNYDSSADFRAQNAGAIADAEARASMTQLQRDIADYNSKRSLALQEYNDHLADLNKTLNDEIQKRNETISLYNSRRQQIATILAAGNKDYSDMATERVKMTKDEVDQEVKYYQDLVSAINAAKSASSSQVGITRIPVSPRASGGPVGAGSTYLVGEEGPELFIPNQNGSILSNRSLAGNSGGNMSVTISIENIYGTDQDAATRFANQIAQILGQQIKLRTV